MKTIRFALCILIGAMFAGCGQKQGTWNTQPTEQAQESNQQQAQDGPKQNANVVTNPHGRGTWNASGYKDETKHDQAKDGPPSDSPTVVATEDGVKLATSAGGNDYSITINGGINFGGQTSGVDGSLTQSPTGTQTPTATSTGGAMNMEPRANLTTPITVSAAPGSSAQGGPTAGAAEGGTTGAQTSSQQATIDYLEAKLKQQAGQLEQAMKMIESLKAAQNPAATKPVPDETETAEPMALDGK